jgi:hypothetical protein
MKKLVHTECLQTKFCELIYCMKQYVTRHNSRHRIEKMASALELVFRM